MGAGEPEKDAKDRRDKRDVQSRERGVRSAELVLLRFRGSALRVALFGVGIRAVVTDPDAGGEVLPLPTEFWQIMGLTTG